MICPNCGANLPDDSTVCSGCGMVLPVEKEPGPLETVAEKITDAIPDQLADKLPGGDKNKLIGLGVIAVAAILAIALVIWIGSLLLGGNGPKDVATKYIKAGLSANGGKTLVSLMPKEYIENKLDDSDDYDTRAELIREINDALEDRKDYVEDYYGKYKVKVEVRKVSDWKNSEIKAYNEKLDNRDYDMQIKDGADVRLRVTINGKDDKDSETTTVSVIKVGGKWYLDFMSNSLPV